METRTNSIGSDEAVIFVNPTLYTLDPSDFDQTAYSSFDDFNNEIVEEGIDKKKGNDSVAGDPTFESLTLLKKQVMTGEKDLDSEVVQREVVLAFRDKVQAAKLKKIKEKEKLL